MTKKATKGAAVRLMVMLLAVALCVGLMPAAALAAGETPFTGMVNVNSVASGLFRDVAGATPIPDDAVVAQSDSFCWGLAFDLDGDNVAADMDKVDAIRAGGSTAKYPVAVPAGLVVAYTADADIDMTIKGSGEVFATLHFEKTPASGDPPVYVTFAAGAGEYWQTHLGVSEGWMLLEVKLAATTDETVEIDVDGDAGSKTLTLRPQENQPAANTLNEKKGAYDKVTGRFTWTIEYTTGSTPAPLLRDSFASGEMAFVTGSMEVAVKDTSPAWTAVTPTAAADGGNTVLTLDFAGEGIMLAEKTTYLIKYETVIADEKLKALNEAKAEFTFGNSAQLYQAGGTTAEGSPVTGSVKVEPGESRLLAKTSENVDADGDGRPERIRWKIEVQCQDRKLDNLVLYDKLFSGYSEWLDAPTNILVYDITDITLSTPLSVGTHYNESVLGADYDVKIEFLKDGSGNYQQGYIVTYETPVKNKLYEQPPDDPDFKVDNAAWLDFDWMEWGSGTPGKLWDYVSPSVTRNAGLKTNLLQKSAAYDRTTGEITWTVVVNPLKVNLTDGPLEDAIDPAKYEYVAGSARWLGVGGVVTVQPSTTFSFASDKLTVNTGDISGNTASFTFKTKVKNTAHYGMNTGSTAPVYTNMVNLVNGTVQPALGGSPVTVNNKASASVKVESKVLAKSGSYSYADNTVAWTVELNHNRMAMDSPVLTDLIPAGQSLVAGSVTLNGGALTESGSNRYSLSADGRTLTITLESMVAGAAADVGTPQHVLSYKTKVDTSAQAFKDAASVTLGNTVKLARGGAFSGEEPLEVTAAVKVANAVVGKTRVGTGDVRQGDKVDYRVEINPNGMPVGGSVITDTMCPGLCLDLDTLTLTEATVTGTTTAAGGSPSFAPKAGGTVLCAASDADLLALGYEGNRTAAGGYTFSITLPAGSASYILTYSCYATETRVGEGYSNGIELEGGGVSAAAGSSACHTGAAAGGAGRIGGHSLTLNLSCREGGHPLHNVAFNIYAVVGNEYKLVGTATTSATGALTFGGLSSSRSYVIRQDEHTLGQHHPGYGWPMVSFAGSEPSHLHDFVFTGISGEQVTHVTNHPEGKALWENELKKNQTNNQEEAFDDAGHWGRSGLPQTGDAAAPRLWVMLAGVAALGLVGLARRRRRA